jgi:benzil reductase ((S)-benzoin forming)
MQTGAGEHVAIVSGVSRGLGAALGRELLDRGFVVLGVGRTENPALAGDRYRFVHIDLAKPAATDSLLTEAFREIEERRPASVCLLNNAATVDGVGIVGRLTSAGISSAIATNLTAAVALANLFCRVIADQTVSRRVINISSGAAEDPLPGHGVYSIAKAGTEMLTVAMAAEHEAPTFQAITLRPGVMDTERQTFFRAQTAELLPVVDLFKGFERDGWLVPPAAVAAKIVSKLVVGEVENGRTYNNQDL